MVRRCGKVQNVAPEGQVMHFCGDGSTGTHEGQIDRPVARGAEFARSKMDMIALRFEDIQTVNAVTQLAGKAEEA